MSTKKLEECLQWVENYLGNEPDAQEARREARAELANIRRAAKTLDRLHVGDFTYNIRDRAAGDASFTGNTWEHPDTKAWSDASVLMGAIAKEDGC